jgi:beta-mannanase
MMLSYADFTRELDVSGLEAVTARGAVPVVTWEPWVAGRGVAQPAYSLDRITAGDFDPYLRRWAEGLRAFGRPVMLRFAHEMNGNWYPWSEGVNGNGPGDYVAAWRHVHDLVAAAGTGQVSWVWSPNVAYDGSAPLAALYPGDRYVDWVGLDGYNWGASRPGKRWQSFETIFGPTLAEIAHITRKPLMLGEVASSEVAGDKAAWIADFFAALRRHPQIRAFVWFEHDKETDWRIRSSEAARNAFAAGIARYC